MSEEKKQILYANTYTWNLENYIDNLIFKAVIETQMQRRDCGHTGGKRGWGELREEH